MQKCHYDAAGRPVPEIFELMRLIDHEPSREILRKKMLYGSIVIPAVEIRIPKNGEHWITIVRHVGQVQVCGTYELQGRAWCGLRNSWRRAPGNGWSKREERLYFVLWRGVRVIPDQLRRWS